MGAGFVHDYATGDRRAGWTEPTGKDSHYITRLSRAAGRTATVPTGTAKALSGKI